MKAARTEDKRRERFIISGALHGVTESAIEDLRAFEAMGGHLEFLPEKQLMLIQYDGHCNAELEAKMIAILQQAGANCESHGVICHGKDHCEPLNLHVGPLAKDHPKRLASVTKHLSRWLRLKQS
ncbi:hypothetical protein [Acidithiobacillus sp.]|uniref:hypothetical protein n=1 Tax=Acidithiobacillus sp. TaxID=1872118 RepID=UPI00261D4947|nr:hypothetical protein [Acidithiobacillus sp.]